MFNSSCCFVCLFVIAFFGFGLFLFCCLLTLYITLPNECHNLVELVLFLPSSSFLFREKQ